MNNNTEGQIGNGQEIGGHTPERSANGTKHEEVAETGAKPKCSTASSDERTQLRRKNYRKLRCHLFGRQCCGAVNGGSLRRAKSEDLKSVQHSEQDERISSRGRSPAAVIASVLPYDDSSTDEASSSVQQQQQNRKLTAQQGGTKNGVGATEQQRDTVITINVSGMRFQAYESTLRRFPNSLLGDPMKRQFYWNDELQEIFLDRSRSCFEAILHIYRHFGQVVRPVIVPVELFIDELIFYELKEDVWANFCESEGCRIRPAEKEPENALQRIIWHLMEHPDSSPFARLLAAISVTVILISTVSFCLESIPELKPADETREWSSPFFWIEFSCCLWFSIELAIRFLAAPSKAVFMKSFLNVLDFIAVAPFFINLMFHDDSKNSSSTSFAVLRIVRLVRVFRIFKLSRHFTGLQVLGKTFQASIQEFFLLIFFMAIALVLFSSGVYFAEQGEQGTKFTSIPASFWYVLATMTTVGYGDLVPHGVYGKIVGSMCALIGVLTLALPVPIIVANFKRFYRQEIILAKMYEQSPPPKKTQSMIQQAKAVEESMTAVIDGIDRTKQRQPNHDDLV